MEKGKSGILSSPKTSTRCSLLLSFSCFNFAISTLRPTVFLYSNHQTQGFQSQSFLLQQNESQHKRHQTKMKHQSKRTKIHQIRTFLKIGKSMPPAAAPFKSGPQTCFTESSTKVESSTVEQHPHLQRKSLHRAIFT